MAGGNPGLTRGGPAVPESGLGTQHIVQVVMAGLLCAVVAFGVTSVALYFQQPRYRAEAQLALLPSPLVPPQEIADSWEALSRGQAVRIAAEVLDQRRWRAAAAQSAGVQPESLTITAGAVADTTLIDIGVEAPTPQAAEQAAESLVREARPVVEQVSGPFVLELLQPAEGSAKQIGTPPGQLLAVAAAAGLLIGSGGALLVIRYRAARALDTSDRRPEQSSRYLEDSPIHRTPGARPGPGGPPFQAGPSGGAPQGLANPGAAQGGAPNGLTYSTRPGEWPPPPGPPTTTSTRR